jgi:hypothetical protein
MESEQLHSKDEERAYDARLKQIQARNDRILGHFVHVWRGRVSDETLHKHIRNIQGFTDVYLNYYVDITENLRAGDQLTAWKVYDFITDWLPRKCWVTSERRVKEYLASFKKYVKFLEEYGYLATEAADEIIETLKEDRQVMIRSAVTYYDEPDEEESPEALRERMQGLVEQWKALSQKSKPEVGDT